MPGSARPLRPLRRLAAFAGGGLALLGLWLALRTPDEPTPSRPGIRFSDTPVVSSAAKSVSPFFSDHARVAAPPNLASIMRLVSARDFLGAIAAIPKLATEERPVALASVFARWGEAASHDAAAAALGLEDSRDRETAWRALVSTWARQNPAGLADYALALPPGAERRQALEEAVRRWLDQDAATARAFVEALPSTPESDAVVATVAQQPAFVRSEPDLALSWAEAIREPALRSRILGVVIREWRYSAPAEAALYARTCPDLLASEREDILVGERFTAHP